MWSLRLAIPVLQFLLIVSGKSNTSETTQMMSDKFVSCMIGSPVDMLRNDATGHVSIHPCNAVQQAALPRTGLPKAVAKEQVARPPNAFILYRQKHHPILKAEYPDLHNNQICE